MSATIARLEKAKDILIGKTFELSITKTYCARWGMVQAVRELIQNALDSDSPFVYEFKPEEDDKFSFWLNSSNAILTPQTLLLGATSKTGQEDAIGSFGEGYKIALLVLTRDGYDTEMLNGDMIWRPRFRFSRTFGEEILVIDESVAPDKTNKGLTFVVHGLTAEECEAIRASCILMHDQVGGIKKTSYGDILLDRPGKLFIGHLYICETEMKFGYNIKPRWMRLERDRQTVAGWEFAGIASKMWIETEEYERIAQMIADSFPDIRGIRYNLPEMVKDACYRHFRKNHPGAIVVGSAHELDKCVEEGMTVHHYSYDSDMYHAVTTSHGYRSEVPVLQVQTPLQHMNNFFSSHRGSMRKDAIVAFKDLMEKAKRWRNG